jgi:hypothetical protein
VIEVTSAATVNSRGTAASPTNASARAEAWRACNSAEAYGHTSRAAARDARPPFLLLLLPQARQERPDGGRAHAPPRARGALRPHASRWRLRLRLCSRHVRIRCTSAACNLPISGASANSTGTAAAAAATPLVLTPAR